jgi:hypothetical protein
LLFKVMTSSAAAMMTGGQRQLSSEHHHQQQQQQQRQQQRRSRRHPAGYQHLRALLLMQLAGAQALFLATAAGVYHLQLACHLTVTIC